MKSQRGNVIVYVLVGLALFGALLGSIWWIRQRAATVQSTPAAPVATQNDIAEPSTETDVKQDEAPAPTPQPSTKPTTDQSNPTQSNTTQQPAPVTKPEAAVPVVPESQTKAKPSAVASSGPVEDALVSSMILGAAVFATTSFVRSRRARS